MLSIRSGTYQEAAKRAGMALEHSPNFAAALRIRSKALVALFASESDPPVRSPETRLAMLTNAATDLEKYLILEANENAKKSSKDALVAIKFFLEYYRQPGNLSGVSQRMQPPDPAVTPFRILRKPAPDYTNTARGNGVEGSAILIVEFRADGQIGHILVGKPLEDSLDQQSVEGARKIRFTPMMRNGVPQTVVKRFEYSFAFR